MILLVLRDLFETSSDERSKAGSGERGRVELGQGLRVESVFKVLESQSVLKEDDIYNEGFG